MPIAQIQRLDVRLWVAHCINTGVTPASIRHLKTLLSAVLTGAMLDGLISFNPCHGLRTPFAPPPPIRILTPEQFNSILVELAHPVAQLLAETAVCTALTDDRSGNQRSE